MAYKTTGCCKLKLIQPQVCFSSFLGTLLIHLYSLFICTHLNVIVASGKFTKKKEIARHLCSSSINIYSRIFIACSGLNMYKQTLPKWLSLFENYENESLLKCQIDSANEWPNYIFGCILCSANKAKEWFIESIICKFLQLKMLQAVNYQGHSITIKTLLHLRQLCDSWCSCPDWMFLFETLEHQKLKKWWVHKDAMQEVIGGSY